MVRQTQELESNNRECEIGLNTDYTLFIESHAKGNQ
jgi:hypothetical protein